MFFILSCFNSIFNSDLFLETSTIVVSLNNFLTREITFFEFILFLFMSIPFTLIPSFDNFTANGNPTYPKP